MVQVKYDFLPYELTVFFFCFTDKKQDNRIRGDESMIRRYCDICNTEIRSIREGTYDDSFTLIIKDPSCLSRLGGQSGEQQPAFSIQIRNCNNRDVCKKCLGELLALEFSNSR